MGVRVPPPAPQKLRSLTGPVFFLTTFSIKGGDKQATTRSEVEQAECDAGYSNNSPK